MTIFVLQNKKHTIKFLDYGACIYEWINNETEVNIILTNKLLEDYKNPKNGFFGLTVGPIANRIKDAKFNLDDKVYHLEKNEGNNNLHSGVNGFWNKYFKVIRHESNIIQFKLNSGIDDDSFPGNKELIVTYILKEDGLRIEYNLITDKLTPVNITNHVYFNLEGKGNILDHHLYVDADQYMSVDKELLPLGLKNLKDTFLDFTSKKLIKEFKDKPGSELGIDHHYQFNKDGKAILESKNTILEFTTSYPGVQIYISNTPSGQLLKNGEVFDKYSGLTLEPQFEIDAINNNYRDITINPNQQYYEWVEYKIINK